MLAVVCCRRGAGRSRPTRDRLLGLSVWRLELDAEGMFARHRAIRGWRRLTALGVRRVLLPEDAFCKEQLKQAGLTPIEPVDLYAALAGPIALAALTGGGEEPSQAVVTLCAARADEPLVRAAHFLCPKVKRLSLCVQQGGERLCAQLYWQYGAAVELGGEGAGLRVCFDGTEDPRALDVRHPKERLPGLLLGVDGLDLPAEWPGDSVLTALWQSGYIRLEQIEVAWPQNKPLTDAKAGTIM